MIQASGSEDRTTIRRQVGPLQWRHLIQLTKSKRLVTDADTHGNKQTSKKIFQLNVRNRSKRYPRDKGNDTAIYLTGQLKPTHRMPDLTLIAMFPKTRVQIHNELNWKKSSLWRGRNQSDLNSCTIEAIVSIPSL